MASAIYYNTPSDPLSKRALFFKYFIRIYYGIKGFNPYHKSNYYYPMMSDNFFSGVCFSLPTSIKRNIPVYIINKKKFLNTTDTDPSYAIFLNEPLYSFYTDFNTYLENLDFIFSQIGSNFKKIYFKFHPDEFESINSINIQKKLSKYNNIEFLKTNRIIEDLTKDYDAKIVISYFCSALNNLLFYGLEPVYIFHLVDFINNNTVFNQLKIYLNALNYNFIKSLNEITPEYKSNLIDKIYEGIHIHELVDVDKD